LVRRSLCVGALLALLAAGCGNESQTATEVERLTAGEFAAQADTICAEFNEKFDKLGASGTEDAGDLIRDGGVLAAAQLEKLKALHPPEESQAAFDEALAALEEEVGLFDDLAAAYDNGDSAKVSEITDELDALDAKANTIANDLDITKCESSSE
jgi:hypothetical protein